jgi:hypothetical protein
MKYQFDLGSSDLDRKNFTLDNIILEEENAEKLSVLSTELISITTGFEKRMKEQDNLYSQNILGFHKGGNGMYYVKFGAKSPGNQDFFKSRTIDGNGYILGSEDLTEKIQEVDVVLDEQRKILDGSMDKMKTFQKKNFVSQFFNKSTKEGIQQKTSASRREVSGLESARKALVLAQDFIQAIQDFEKRSGVEVDGSRNSNISSFRQEYLAQLEKKLKPAPKAARY